MVLALPILFVVSLAIPDASLAVGGSSHTAPADGPNVKPAGEIHKLIKSLPNYAPFSFTGIAFYKDRLFAGTNIGLIELKNALPQTVYQWTHGDAVVEGPWADDATDSLWIQRDHDGALLRLDQKGWHLVKLPDPPKGYFSRGDVLGGFRGVCELSGFRFVGGGFVWKRDVADHWTLEPSPPVPEYSSLEGIAFFDSFEVLVVKLGASSVQPCGHVAYWREANTWGTAINLPFCCVNQVLGAADGVGVRGGKGSLVRVTRTEAVTLPAPGPVEAMTLTSSRKALVSVAGAGICVDSARSPQTVAACAREA